MTGLRPAFKKDGTVTAANASGINDGGAAIILMSAKDAEARNAPVLGRIASWATCGVEPEFMGIGPAPASRIALEKAGWKLADLDLIEANEAFAAQALSVGKELGWRSEEHTSELQSLMRSSYAVFSLKKKKQQHQHTNNS